MSQLYSRVFLQILDSSIADDFMLRHVFEDFLKLVDHQTHIVDMTRQALARRLNIPLDLLNDKINILESPDPSSRDKEFDGRRIERLDEHRDWGWRILNFDKYDEIRTRADVAIRVARHRDRKKNDADIPETLDAKFHREWVVIVAYYGGKCAYCGIADYTDIEHMIPISKGGKHEGKNVVPSCGSCNSKKGVSIPDGKNWVLIKPHPLLVSKSPLQLRAEALMKRKPETQMDKADERAWKSNLKVIESTSEEDWVFLEVFYAAPQSETFARKNLATLLNNWNGEIERAKNYVKNPRGKNGGGSAPQRVDRSIGTLNAGTAKNYAGIKSS